MFVHYRSQGIVLKKEDRGEADQLFTVYTKDFGKLDVLGRAIRKITSKLRSSVDDFSISEIEFIQGKVQKILTDAIPLDKFKNLRSQYRKAAIAQKIAELMDNTIKGQEPDEETWQLTSETFSRMNDSADPFNCSLLYYYFLWNFLAIMGYRQDLYFCSKCQQKLKPEPLYFNAKEGGLICSRCHNDQTEMIVSPDTVKIIRILLKRDWFVINKLKIKIQDLKYLKIISNRYLSQILSGIQ